MTTTPRQAAIALLESIANARSREDGINLPPHHSLNYHDNPDECWAWLDMWSEQVKTDPECTIKEQVLELIRAVLEPKPMTPEQHVDEAVRLLRVEAEQTEPMAVYEAEALDLLGGAIFGHTDRRDALRQIHMVLMAHPGYHWQDHTKLPHTEQHEGEQDGQTMPG